MITVICATHRPKNQTTRVVEKYVEILKELGEEVKLFQLSELPADFVTSDTFGNRTRSTESIINEKLIPASRLVIISPEYNGSYPGAFKTFLDGVNPGIWKGKKAALVGVASGRAGNLRGMDHLTDVLHYLRVEVFSLKIPISRLDALLNDNGEFADQETLQLLQKQASEFIKY